LIHNYLIIIKTLTTMANLFSLSIKGINVLLPEQAFLVRGGHGKKKNKKKSNSRSGSGSRKCGGIRPTTGGTGAGGGGTVTTTPPPVIIADQA
jgi:hypothetical protein